jgi:aryl-alcohol dehydrogenase-like predicted oxidoreductase
MQKRTLGRSGLEVSALGMGCWAIGGPWTWDQPGREPYPAGWGDTDDEESIRAVHAALDLGVNFFDTAANYGAGHSEVVLGQALKGRRGQVVIATKFGHIVDEEKKTVYGDPDQIIRNVRKDVENSLRRLQTDYIDIYQLHEAVTTRNWLWNCRSFWRNWFPRERSAGTAGARTSWTARANSRSGAHCTSIQFRLNAIFDNPEMRKVCADFDLGGVNKDPLNKGILTGKFSSNSKFPGNDIRSRADFSDPEIVKRLELVEALREILTSGGRTMAQGALAYIWALDERMVPIPGFKSVQQVKENAGALEFGPLSEAQVKEIQTIVGKNTTRKVKDMSERTQLRWHDPAWQKSAHEWIRAQAERNSIRLTGEIEQPHVYHWSTVMRVPTAEGFDVFKATAGETIHEIALTEKLAGGFPIAARTHCRRHGARLDADARRRRTTARLHPPGEGRQAVGAGHQEIRRTADRACRTRGRDPRLWDSRPPACGAACAVFPVCSRTRKA